MFDSHSEAAKMLRAHFDEWHVEALIRALVPAIVFEPIPEARTAVGETRLGGAPDLPSGIAWPRPPTPVDIEGIARRGNKDAAEHMRRHLALGLPYAFVAQVDLAEAAALGSVASDLPREGRLLFFYDLAVGPWETGTRPARVIWDCSPNKHLATLEMPKDLAAAAEHIRRENEEVWTRHRNQQEGREHGTIYGAPAQMRRLKPTLRLPSSHAIELTEVPELNALYHGATGGGPEAFREIYDQVLEAYHDDFPDEAWRRQQLLGSPSPEQNDPRGYAVVVSEFGKQWLSPAEWAKHGDMIAAQRPEWMLLLQIDLDDWMQVELVEGTIYFLIRRSDLAQRRFDMVVAVYQQT